MKNINYNFLLFLLGLGFMVACTTSTDPVPTSTTLTGITIARTTGTGNVKVVAGGTLNLTSTFKVTPKPASARLGTLSWTVDAKSGSSATASISGTTLTAGTTAGDITLTVKSGTGTAAKSATIDITIEAAAIPALTGITIGDPTGQTLGTVFDLTTLTITAEPAGAVTGDLTWSIPTVTPGYTLEGTMLSSVIADATGLTVTVQASTSGATPITAMKTITFPAPALASFTIGDPSGHVLGTALDLNALTFTTDPVTATTGVLTWTIPTETAGYSVTDGTLNSDATTATGLTVTVQAVTSGTPPITVTKEIAFPVPALASITVARTTGTDPVNVPTGGTLELANTFTVTPSPSIAAVGTLTWTVDAKSGSSATASISGTTLTAGAVAGDMTLTVSSDAVTPAETATIDITIEASAPPALVGFTIEDPTGTLALGTSLDLSTLTITTDPVAAVTGDLTWSIPTTTAGYNIASSSSLLTSDATTATGLTVIVQATTSGASPKTAMKTITFPAPALTSIAVARAAGTDPVTVTTGGTLDLSTTFTVTGVPGTAAVGTLTWTVAAKAGSTATATITGTTLTAGAVAGDMTLTVSSDAVTPAETTTIDITIEASAPPALVGFTIEDPTGTLALGTSLDLSTLTITTDPVAAVTGDLTWSIPTATVGYNIASGSSLLASDATTATGLTVTVQATTSGASPKTAMKTITFPAPALTSIAVARAAGTDPVTVTTGGTLDLSTTFTVTGVPGTAAVGTLTWTVAAKSGSTATATITGTTLTAGAVAGDMTLTVSSDAVTPAETTTIDITIEASSPPALVGFTIEDPSGTLALGTSLDLSILTITTDPVAAVTGDLTWTIPTMTAGYSIASSSSLLASDATAATGLTVIVQATTSGASPKTAMKTITFPAPALTGIAVARAAGTGTGTVTVPTGDTLDLSTTFTVTPSPSTAAVGTLTWTVAAKMGSSATATITGTTLTAGTVAGDMTLTVSSDAVTPAETATIDITIEASAPPALVGFTIEDPTGTLALGTPLDLSTLTITTDPVAAVTGDLTWSIPTATAGYNIASGSSLLASDATTATGLTVTVQATTSGASPKTAMKTITFPAPALTGIAVRRTTGTDPVTVPTGGTLNLANTFTVTGVPGTAAVGTLTWTVAAKAGSTATATIADGTATLTAGAVAGEMTLTVSSDAVTPAETTTIDITIEASASPALVGFTIEDPTGTLALGTSLDLSTLTITTDPVAAVTGDLTWTIPTMTAGYSIASSSSLLASDATTATGLTVTVQATTSGASPKTAMKTITFPAPALTSIAIASTSGTDPVTVPTGGTLDLSTTFTVTPNPSTAAVTLSWTATAATTTMAGGTVAGVIFTAGSVTGDVTVFVTALAVPPITQSVLVTIVASSSQPPAAVERTNADLQGMIVGSTGHFYAHTTTTEKKMTIVIDGNTMHLNHDATASTATDLHFKTTDDRNTMVLNVPATGTPTVTSLNLMGHAGAVAEVTTVDHSTTTAATEVPLIFEGYETFYGIKRSDYTTPIDLATSEPTQAELDAKIELYRTHYNVVVKGGTNAKLVVMANFITTEAEKTRLEAIWSAANIGYNPPFSDIATGNHPNKFELTISSRTDTEIVASRSFTRPGSSNPETQTITFPITTDHGKLKMILPLQKLTDSVNFQDKTADMITRVKPLHAYFTREINSVVHYYRFPDYTSYNEFTSAPAYSAPGVALNDSLFNAIASFAASKGGTKVARDDAYETVFPEYQTYQYSESVLTEIR